MGHRTHLLAGLCACLTLLSCSAMEIIDHSFGTDCTVTLDPRTGHRQLEILLTEGLPEDTYSLTWTIDGRKDLSLSRNGRPVRQGDEIRFGNGRKAAYGLPDLEMGSHSLTAEVSNGYITSSRSLDFSITPEPFSYEAKVRTGNIAVSMLEIEFTKTDSREEYRADILVDGQTVIVDSLITVPSFKTELPDLRPGTRTCTVRIRDSWSEEEQEFTFTEPARERFMDLVMDCTRDRYGRPVTYHLTAMESGLPYSAEISGDFRFHGSVDVMEQTKEGAHPTSRTYTKTILKPCICSIGFDGSKEDIMDAADGRRAMESYGETSILSWFWDEHSDRYTPDETGELPYTVDSIIPDLKVTHENLPGVRIRITSNVGKVIINNIEHTEKEFII